MTKTNGLRQNGPRQNGLFMAIAMAVLCLNWFVLADEALSDVAGFRPAPQRSEPLPLRLEEAANAPVHRIVIPKAVLAKLAGDLPDAGHVAMVPHGRSIVAALALSAAVACGLVAARRGRPGRVASAVLCGLAVAGAGALLGGAPAVADIAVPGQARSPDTRPRPRPRPWAGGPASVTLTQGARVLLEIGEGGDAVVLVVGTAAEGQEPKKSPPMPVPAPPG